MKKMTLTNSFHGTEVTILVRDETESPAEAIQILEWRAARDPAAARALRRVWRDLCGIPGCQCGTVRE
jgi:hypothetical protein